MSELRSTVALDPVLREVLRHEFICVTEDMNVTMRRTTRSVVAKETSDFSSALLDSAGTVVAQAVPYGITVFCQGVKELLRADIGPLEPGDVIITNNPYAGLSHLADILVLMPVFVDGSIIGFASTVQHHTDVGGRFPGGFGADSRELFEEGLLLTAVRLYSAGKRNDDVFRILAANTRAPDDLIGDLEANVAACRRGAHEFVAVAGKYGLETIKTYLLHAVSTCEKLMRSVISGIPDGTYRVGEILNTGGDDNLHLVLTLTVRDDELVVDLTGTSPQSATAWNVPPGLVLMPVAAALFGLIGESDFTINEGLLMPITLVAPRGSLAHPEYPAAVASRAQAMLRFGDMMQAALAMACPERIPASGDGGPSLMTFSPVSEAGGASVMTDLWSTGWGARPDRDGVDGVVPMLMNGFRVSSAETLEQEMPIRLEGFGFVTDSGGAGTFRGSMSVFRRYCFLRPGRVMLRTCRVSGGGPGLAGGHAGGAFSARLIRAGGSVNLPTQSVIDLEVIAGDIIEHISPGAGGFGVAALRDPRLVANDVVQERVSVVGAARDYQVVVDELGVINDELTNSLRASEQNTVGQ